ncbi:hypothetical protein KP509_08G040200 [Ceratopteris richardii]|uniref:J domain-containing protein n=1 Tax=Ceratopteris richardii TaxID=49495 RepID=A0A8T2U501_CERRI|nr:hypothetical protein KP509_08G040200 [Ceratopteris richardii]
MTHYAVLGVGEDATQAEIRASYLSSLLSMHPDKHHQLNDFAASGFLRLQEAWEVLRDPRSRSSYDRELASSRLLVDGVVAEDVLLEEMEKRCSESETTYFHPCRCGDFFSVSSHEIGFHVGGCKEPFNFYNFTKQHDLEAGANMPPLPDNHVPAEDQYQHVHQSGSLILPCNSCSLQIRLLI